MAPTMKDMLREAMKNKDLLPKGCDKDTRYWLLRYVSGTPMAVVELPMEEEDGVEHMHDPHGIALGTRKVKLYSPPSLFKTFIQDPRGEGNVIINYEWEPMTEIDCETQVAFESLPVAEVRSFEGGAPGEWLVIPDVDSSGTH